MARKIDWERHTLNRKARFGLSVKDEAEFRKTDVAARWLVEGMYSLTRRSEGRFRG